jgi:hypothetical protein
VDGIGRLHISESLARNPAQCDAHIALQTDDLSGDREGIEGEV